MPRNLSSPWSTPRQTRSGRHAMAATNTPDQEGTHRRIRKLPSSFQPIWTPNDAFQTPNLFANPVASATRTPSRTPAHLNVLGSQDPGRLAAAHIGFSDPSQFKDAAACLAASLAMGAHWSPSTWHQSSGMHVCMDPYHALTI